MAIFTSSSVEETEAIGRQLARDLRAGDVLGLQGELGAGKTHLVKGMLAGMGSAAAVTSPTFTLLHEYEGGRLPIYHFDFFRLEDRRAAERLALDEYFFGEGVSLVEWADKFPDLMPAEARWGKIETIPGEARRIEVL